MSAAAAVEWSLLAERIGNEVDMETESQEGKERERRKREKLEWSRKIYLSRWSVGFD